MPGMLAVTFDEETRAGFVARRPKGLDKVHDQERLHLTVLHFPGDLSIHKDTLFRVTQLVANFTPAAKAKLSGKAVFQPIPESTSGAPVVALVESPVVLEIHDWASLFCRIYDIPFSREHAYTPHVTWGNTDSAVEFTQSENDDMIFPITQLSLFISEERWDFPLERRVGTREAQDPMTRIPKIAGEIAPPTFEVRELAEMPGASLHPNRIAVEIIATAELRGSYPDLTLPEDIDREALGAEAFFVTLPIGRVDARSLNGRVYTRAAVQDMVDQINENRTEGQWGHLNDEELSHKYPPPAIRWLVAMIDGSGTAWGKGLPLTQESREYYRLAKATNARVGTSLLGWALVDGEMVTALDLDTVDIADPARVGVPMTAAKPMLTKDMRETHEPPTPSETPVPAGDPDPTEDPPVVVPESPVPDEVVPPETPTDEPPPVVPPVETPADLPVEDKNMNPTLPVVPEKATNIELVMRTRDTLQTQLTEQKDLNTAYKGLVGELTPLLGTDQVKEMPAAIKNMQDAQVLLVDEMITLLVENRIAATKVRPFVLSMVRSQNPKTAAEVREAFDGVIAQQDVQDLIETSLPGEMGGVHRRGIVPATGEDFFGLGNDTDKSKKKEA